MGRVYRPNDATVELQGLHEADAAEAAENLGQRKGPLLCNARCPQFFAIGENKADIME